MIRTTARAHVGLLALLITACGGSPTAAPVDAVHELDLGAPLRESPETGFLSGNRMTHHQLLVRLAELTDDSRARGLLLHGAEFGGAFARAADLRRALERLREAGKPIHCYIEMTDNLGYALLANGCDRISMTPTGMINLVGMSAEAVYARELLSAAGLQADLLQVGKFKGAADPFTRDSMPDEVRQNLDAMLDDLHAILIASLTAGRKIAPEQAQPVIDGGPYTARDALAAGLIDDVGFDDEAREHARVAAKVQAVVEVELEADDAQVDLADLIQALLSKPDRASPKGQRIVLANLDGTIARGRKGSMQSADAAPFVAAMRRFADDAQVRAVVLRIDSPGGSATASDLMWHAVRRVAARKPVIVSVGDMAASGGYWVASAGTEILADDASIIGSIGVVGGKIVAEALSDRAGLGVTRLTRGKRAGWLSGLRGFTDDERLALGRSLDDTYRLFIRRISVGRKMTPEQIAPVAEGRIMTGARARAGGLVDREGGLLEALALARERSELPDDARVQVWPSEPTLMEQISQLTGGAQSRTSLMAELFLVDPLRSAAGLLESLVLGDDTHIAAMPFWLRVR